MLKKLNCLITAVLVMAPMLAHSYSLTTRINSLSGQLQVASFPVQTSGSVLRSIPNVNPAVPVVITPAAGYVISKVQQGTTYLTVIPAGQTVTIPANNTAAQTINVWFDKKAVSVTAFAGTGGSVSPSGTQNLQPGTVKSYVFTPATGNKVVSLNGLPSGSTVTPAVPAATNAPVTVTITVPATTVTMSAVFQSVIANAGSPQTVLTGSTTTLDGTASTGGNIYSWTQTAGTPVTLSSSSAAQPTFTASVAGSYQFRLVVTDGSGGSSTAYTTVIVTASATEAAQIQCQECHQANGIGVTANVYGNWSQSPHSSGSPPVMCYGCHVGADSGGHPGPLLSSLANICSTCHGASPQGHPVEIGANTCVSCHNPHSTVATMQGAPHFNSITSGMYPASYMTSKAACANCHYNSPVNASHRQEWNKSGHAATTDLPWIIEDFKTMSGCVQCHTTTGFIAYSTGKVTTAWGVASDKTKEVLRCNGCHKDVPNGIVRTMAPVRPYADDSYTNRDVGKSNLCMACHSGRRNGASITVQLDALADFTNLPFIDPHNHASGGNLHGKSGYHFPGQTYAFYSTNSHRRIGSANFSGSGTSGPCIACHRNDTNAHTNKSLVNTLCGNCHGATFTVEQLYVDKQGYTNALVILNAMLAAKGHPYSATQPYFSNTNWGVGQEGANTMGAAFNYVMLRFDNGAYAHNSAYAKQLIFDSIDYLYNGAITGSIEGALSYLVTNNNITQGAADSVRAYKAEINCTICHTYSSGSHPAHLNSGFGCVDCHSSTAASNTTIVPGNTTHVNGVPDLQAGPGRSFSYSAGTCSNISCHNNGTAVWGTTLGCDGCHDCPPATASHLKHYGGTIAQAGYGNTGIAQDITANSAYYIMNCGNCHPMDKAKHGNGIVDIELHNPLAPAGSLKALNPASAAYVAGKTVFTDSRGMSYTKGACSNVYCHSYNSYTTSAPIPDSDPNWESKVIKTRIYRDITWGGVPLTCSGCHGNPTQTSYPGNDGGAGDSHSWIDPDGFQNLHTYNMGSTAPISCSYCHNDTIKQLNTFTADINTGNWTLSNVPISNFSKHVNGRNDVAFDKQNPFVYNTYYGGSGTMSLSNATYDPATKTCSNVSCHLQETIVKWGTPYRYYYNECDRCHGYAY